MKSHTLCNLTNHRSEYSRNGGNQFGECYHFSLLLNVSEVYIQISSNPSVKSVHTQFKLLTYFHMFLCTLLHKFVYVRVFVSRNFYNLFEDFCFD
jgi:hypothetical protein